MTKTSNQNKRKRREAHRSPNNSIIDHISESDYDSEKENSNPIIIGPGGKRTEPSSKKGKIDPQPSGSGDKDETKENVTVTPDVVVEG